MNSKLNMSGWKVSRLTPSRVDTPEGSISVSWSSNSDGGERERKAEEAARLIAAAPSMLHTLVECERVLARLDTLRHLDPEWPILDEVRAQIAKATGEVA